MFLLENLDTFFQTQKPPNTTQKPPNTTANPGGPFKCPLPDGFFSDPVDCTKYYQCANNHPFHMSCPPGTEWDETQKTCEWPADTTCFQKKNLNLSQIF